MRTPLWQRLAVGTALAALVSGLTISALAEGPRAPSPAAGLFDPATLAGSRCTGRSASYMRLFAQIGMARLSQLAGLGGKKQPKPEIPLYDGLGDLSFKVSTKSKLAQSYFDQGLRLSYAFNHQEAVRSFKQAQALDPKCAMCFWGEAYALGPNINLPMQQDAVAPAYAAIGQAQALAKSATPREQALIKAMAARYSDVPPADRTGLDKAYARAMAEVAAAYPDDPDVLSLYAESMMDIHPWDYWKPGGTQPNADEEALVPTIEKALSLAPSHPGAIHFYIHAMEATPNVKKAEAPADRLVTLMPAAGHLVHMPGHIYMRVGRQEDSIKVNLEAVEQDEKFIASRNGEVGFYGAAYYPHNVHFVLVSAELAGDTDTVRAMAKKLDPLVPDAVMKIAAFAQPVKAAPLLSVAHLGDEASVMAAPKPAADFPYLIAMWHYARGVVFARKNDVKGASAELAEIKKIAASGMLEPLTKQNLPAPMLARMADHVLSARIAQARGRNNEAIAQLRKAAELQAAIPYTEPPYWYYPVKQSLGGLLLASGKAKEASDVFRSSLVDQPGNAWAIYGLMKSYEAMGDEAAAEETKKHFDEAWVGKDQSIDVKWL